MPDSNREPQLKASSVPLVRYRNRAITALDLTFIEEQMGSHPGLGRTGLSRLLCEHWDWRAPTGRLKEFACRDLLLRLEEWGHVKLPARQAKNGQKKKASAHCLPDLGVWTPESPDEMPTFNPGPELLEGLVVSPVVDRRERLIWRALMERYHYLGEGVMCGEHLLYQATLPTPSGRQIVALLGWGAASLRNPKRDLVLGWNFEKTRSQLHFVANNLRFLILPWIEIKNLGSRVLALNLKRLSTDWQSRYAHPLVLAETFVDTSRFQGTVYKAANWRYLAVQELGGQRDLRSTTRYAKVRNERVQEVQNSMNERLTLLIHR